MFNYVAIGITSVKISGKYAASGINYAEKFYNIGHWAFNHKTAYELFKIVSWAGVPCRLTDQANLGQSFVLKAPLTKKRP
jgi:hypothetical protein